jgi:hypothetical protein
MRRRSGAREVVDLVDLDVVTIDHVVPDELEAARVRTHGEVLDVLVMARVEVVDTKYAMTCIEQALAKV